MEECCKNQYLVWGETGHLTCKNCGAENTSGMGIMERNPKTVKLYEALEQLDYEHGDVFCFKHGGEGDNGEHLMDLLDIYFARNK